MANVYPQVIVFDETNVGLVGMLGNNQTWTGTNTFTGLLIVGLLQTSGRRQAVAIKTSDYTLTSGDEVIVFTVSATATLPSATGTGQTYRICNEGTGTVTIDGSGSDTIKGELTQSVSGGEDLIVTDYMTGKWA